MKYASNLSWAEFEKICRDTSIRLRDKVHLFQDTGTALIVYTGILVNIHVMI
jgi:hypothetical protein